MEIHGIFYIDIFVPPLQGSKVLRLKCIQSFDLLWFYIFLNIFRWDLQRILWRWLDLGRRSIWWGGCWGNWRWGWWWIRVWVWRQRWFEKLIFFTINFSEDNQKFILSFYFLYKLFGNFYTLNFNPNAHIMK